MNKVSTRSVVVASTAVLTIAVSCAGPKVVKPSSGGTDSTTAITPDGPEGYSRIGTDSTPAIMLAGPEGYNRIEAGSFMMGSPADEPGRLGFETEHRVTISHSFWLKTTEVTQGEWQSVMGSNPSRWSGCGANCPVDGVSWFDAVAYVNALSRSAGLDSCYALSGCTGTPGTGCADWSKGYCEGSFTCTDVRFAGLGCRGYRLPTEAEWEYAARAGTTTALYSGRLAVLDDHHAPEFEPIGWYSANSLADFAGAADCEGWKHIQPPGQRCGPQQVGKKRANPWGLFDMLGNVWEWTGDNLDDYQGAATDPLGAETGSRRVKRGGCWDDDAQFARAAMRHSYPPASRADNLGFRPAKSIP